VGSEMCIRDSRYSCVDTRRHEYYSVLMAAS